MQGVDKNSRTPRVATVIVGLATAILSVVSLSHLDPAISAKVSLPGVDTAICCRKRFPHQVRE